MSDAPGRPTRDALGVMLRSAGRRRSPPQETAEAVYLSTLLAWQSAVRRRRLRFAWALAATLAAAASGIGWWAALRTGSPPLIAATVVHVMGGGLELAPGMPIPVGRPLEVPAGHGIALRTAAAGYAVHLAGPARLRFLTTDGVRLEAGRLYFDSGTAASQAAAFTVETTAARVTHVGTQFAVLVQPDGLRVRVREGAVEIAAGAATARVARGFEAHVSGHAGGRIEQRPTTTSGTSWSWADQLLPAIEVDGRSLAEVLEQIARESGRRLEYAGEAVRNLCRSTLLHGPPIDLSPDERLAAVLASTELEAAADGERILIRPRSGEPATP